MARQFAMHAQFIHYRHRFFPEAYPIKRYPIKRYPIDRKRTNGLWRPLLLCLALPWLALLTLAGCSHWQAVAQRDGLQQRVVQGDAFRHRLLWNAAAQQALATPSANPRIWHLYLEGDGQAVTLFGQPSADPTPLAPLLLPVLALDTAPALYLGRPCYFATDDPHCQPRHWTLERYSATTVASLRAAAAAFIPLQDRIILIGHSGGGTLAMLLASQLPQSCAVITLAGNLDVNAWLSAHQFTPLPDSLDPAQQPPLPAIIQQWHFAGADDKVILPRWIRAVSERQPDAHYTELANTDHIRPWQQHLRESLQDQSQRTTSTPLRMALDKSQSVCGKVTESAAAMRL